MKVFGITGGVGAGKSEVLTYLGQNYDATVIQADEAGYLVMLPGGECYGEIVKLFGRQITTETGELDRKRIAEIVFQDEEKLKALYNAALFTTAFTLLTLRNQTFMRVQQYYALFLMLLVPEMVKAIDKKHRWLVYFGGVSLLIVKLILNHPYYVFFWQ